MREIKFRGLDREGKWFIGSHLKTGTGMHYIVPQNVIGSLPQYSVRAETVGQYTGLNDKNGVEIYEGDILTFEDDKFVWSVEYDLCCFVANGGEYNQKEELIEFYDWKEESLDVVIIGNIYENPHLLEVAQWKHQLQHAKTINVKRLSIKANKYGVKAQKCIAQGNVYFNRSDTLNKRFCVKNILLEVQDEYL